MDPTRVRKTLSLYSQGLVSISEVANWLLLNLVSSDSSDLDLQAEVAELPDELTDRLRSLLGQIQRDGYRWKPFLIGPIQRDPSSEFADPTRLRRLCELLEVNQ